jgi:hypothetical protein
MIRIYSDVPHGGKWEENGFGVGLSYMLSS